MKKLFFFLLRCYSKTENERLEILSILHEQVEKEYYEQTTYGNVYNANIEFLMANQFVNKIVNQDDAKSLKIIRAGLRNSTSEAFGYIKTRGKENLSKI